MVGLGNCPQPLPDVAGSALVECYLTMTMHIKAIHLALFHFERAQFHGQLVDAVFAKGRAGLLQWAGGAGGCFGCAHRGSEIHDGLVIGRSLVGRQIVLCHRGKQLLALRGVDGLAEAKIAGENTIEVAVDGSMRLMEGHAGDGSRRIVAHAFQPAQVGIVIGECALLDDLLGGMMQVPRTRIIA